MTAIDGKLAVVTGAASGIVRVGAALAIDPGRHSVTVAGRRLGEGHLTCERERRHRKHSELLESC
jgi:NADP-dependent 3-hydroxy acid dehydrogenase YdfG